MNGSTASPQQAVRRIREQYLDAPDDVLESLSGHSDVVQMNFAASYFPLEFIQNADDEGATSIRFQLREGPDGPHLEILNNGRPFTQPGVATAYQDRVREDVSGLCKAGKSPKTPRNHIGFIGVGFKSIFEVSDHVEVHSNGFHFEFNRDRTQAQNEENPWRVIPWWIPDEERTATAPTVIEGTEYSTRFVAHLQSDAYEQQNGIFAPLSPDSLDKRVFLFLTELDRIIIDDQIAGTKRVLRRGDESAISEQLHAKLTDARERYQVDADALPDREQVRPLVVEEDWEGETSMDYWIVFSDQWTVPDDVKADQDTQDYFRGNVDSRELFIAVQATEAGRLQRPEERSGTLHTGVFSYLPLKELETDFSFLVHADFLTPADRQTIKPEVRWNQRIIDALVGCLKNVLTAVAGHPVWWRDLGVLVPGDEGGEFIVENFQKPIRDFVRKETLVRDTDGNRVKVEDCIQTTDAVADYLTVDEVEQIKSRRPIHPAHRDVHQALKPRAKIHDFCDHLTNSGSPQVFNGIAGSDRAESVFAAILKDLAEERSKFRQRKALRKTGLLSEDGTAVGTNDEHVYLPPEAPGTNIFDANPFEDVQSELHLLSREVRSLAGEAAEEVYDNIAIDPISDEEIIRIWAETVEMAEQTAADRRRAVEFCYRGVQNDDFEADDIDGLLLETVSGDWEQPEHLFLPVEYEPAQPAHRLSEMDWLETIPEHVRRDRFGNVEGIDATLEFVTPAYLPETEQRSQEIIERWRSFFREIGVDRAVTEDTPKRQFVGAIGELYVYHRLTSSGDLPDPSNVTIGHDIALGAVETSHSDKIIEVKSTAAEHPEISLTRTQTDVLKQNQDRYWIYAVTEALLAPTITRADGRTVRERGATEISISTDIWTEIAEPFTDYSR